LEDKKLHPFLPELLSAVVEVFANDKSQMKRARFEDLQGRVCQVLEQEYAQKLQERFHELEDVVRASCVPLYVLPKTKSIPQAVMSSNLAQAQAPSTSSCASSYSLF